MILTSSSAADVDCDMDLVSVDCIPDPGIPLRHLGVRRAYSLVGFCNSKVQHRADH